MTMTEFVIHSIPGSPFGRAVLLALEEKGCDYRFALVPPGSLRQPEHQARHPFSRIPVLEHGAFRLYETQAILRYLDRVAPEPALTPVDPQRAAVMDQMMNVNDWYLFQGVSNVIGFERVVAPRLMGRPTDEAAIAATMPRAQAVFAALADHLADQPYFAGDAISLADLMLAPQIDFYRGLPEWDLLISPHANLLGWIDRMCARPSMVATTWERVAERAKAA